MVDLVVFNYEQLSVEERDSLRKSEDYIHQRVALTHDLMVQIGHELAAQRQTVFKEKYQAFCVWCRTSFGFSEDTATNFMNVAAKMPSIPAGKEKQISQKAKYTLTSATASGDAVQVAMDLLESGYEVDPDLAYIIAYAPLWVRESVIGLKLPAVQAVELTKALKSVMPDVAAYCTRLRVRDGDVVRYLNEACKNQKVSGAWHDIVSEGGILNGEGWSVPIAEANLRDVERYKEGRKVKRQMEYGEQFDQFEVRGAARVIKTGGGKSVLGFEGDFPVGAGDEVQVTIYIRRRRVPTAS